MVIYISYITICWCLNHLKNLQKGAWLNHGTAGCLTQRQGRFDTELEASPVRWVGEWLKQCFFVATQVGIFHGDLMVI